MARAVGLERLKIWQYGKGRRAGISCEVDLNRGYFELPRGWRVGARYKIKSGDRYSNGRAVPKRLVGRKFTIKLVREGRILLGEINSWVVV